MLPCTGERSQRHTILHVSFGNSFGLASAQPPHRVCRVRHYSLTNDRLYTKMDVEAFVRKELIAIYGKEEFKRINVNVHVEGAAEKESVQRGLYVDIEFKDKKNYEKALDAHLDMKIQRQIIDNSCISMPILTILVNLDK